VPVLLATSDIDEWVPLARAEETRRVLEHRGAQVTWRVYEGLGHEINDDEIAFVEKLLGATPRSA
jgi:phospholipase/carboxylesterase